ncbi:hypothetical protein BDF19DRAFT_424143 [Syncephalis fuscata]|nr:hypothetical protein BDF19DRAFT_424143 [Syncephalis fuscata]
MTKRRRINNNESSGDRSSSNAAVVKSCQVCKQAEAKYKCPTCYLPFCSVTCSRKHKEIPCQPPVSESVSASFNTPSEEVIEEVEAIRPLTNEQLAKIDTSKEIQQQLCHSRLKATIEQILENSSQTQRDEMLAQRLGSDEDFRNFTSQLLNVVGYQESDADRARELAQASQRKHIQATLQQATISGQSEDEINE